MSYTDDEIRVEISNIVENSDLSKLTKRIVRRRLEEAFELEEGELDSEKERISKILEEVIKTLQEQDDDGEEEEEEAPEKPKKKPSKRKPNNNPGSATGLGGGLRKPMLLSKEMQEFTGEKYLPRTDVVKRIWDYVKLHSLQDATDRRQINVDDKLKKLLGSETSISMFKMNSLLKNHFKEEAPAEIKKQFEERFAAEAAAKAAQGIEPKRRKKKDKEPKGKGKGKKEEPKGKGKGKNAKDKDTKSSRGKAKSITEDKKKKKSTPKKASSGGAPNTSGKLNGLQTPVQVSDQLQRIVADPVLPRTEVTKRVHAYLKTQVKDEKDKKQIHLDSVGQDVFGVKTVTHFSIATHLKHHLTKIPQ